jgi:hypothetical protein
MSDSIDRQFEEADAAVTQAVTRFASEIESMFGKWEAVAPPYIIQNMLLERTRPTKTALFDAGYSAKRVTLGVALRSSGDACRGFERG